MLFTCVQVENAIDITTNAEGIKVVSVTVDADLYGDVNDDGVVDDSDVEIIQNYIDGVETLSVSERIYTDTNADEIIDENDIEIIHNIILESDVTKTQTAWYYKYSVQTCGDLEFEYLENCTIQISGCDSTAEAVVIPSQINGMSVVSIGDSAFK